MGTLWEDVKKTVKEGFTVAVEKTEEYGKIGKVKVEILKLERDRDKAFKDLGNEVYGLIKKNKASVSVQNDKIKKMVTKIDNLKKSIKTKENEIERIKKELNCDTLYVISTGGIAEEIAKQSSIINEAKPLLTLEGLRLIYLRNS